VIPLSHGQQRLYLLDQFYRTGAAYNTVYRLRLVGELDVAALSQALLDVLERHEVLRTCFPSIDGTPYQRIVDIDRVAGRLSVIEGADEKALLVAARYVFDLTRESPFRPTLFVRSRYEHILLLNVHHIATDGASNRPLLHDLAYAYGARLRGEKPDWVPLPVQYADYALWQRELLGAPDDPDSLQAVQIAYWRDTLASLPEELKLPTDRPRPAVPSYQGGAVPFHVHAVLHRALRDLARDSRSSLFIVLHAVVAALLHRLGAGTDIPLGTVTAGRPDPALDDLVGFFVNTIALRTDLSGDPSFEELVRRTRDADLAAFSNLELPFDTVVEALGTSRSPARHPLFQTMVVLQSTAEANPVFPGLTAETGFVVNNSAKFDLTFDLAETWDAGGRPAGISGALKYAADLWDRSSAVSLAARFTRLLEAVAARPDLPISRAGIVSDDEAHRLVVEWNATTQPYPDDLSLVTLFERRVDAEPERIAVVAGEDRVSFAEVDRRANQLAWHLRSLGVRRGDLVGLYLERSLELVVSLLGILKAGAGYLPLDPAHPPSRVRTILLEGRVEAMVGTRASALQVPDGVRAVLLDEHRDQISACPTNRPAVRLTGADTACVLFTSGSTGRPKGVCCPHRAAVRTFFGQSYVDFASDHVWLLTAPVSWDAMLLELWPALLHGATCVVAPGQRTDPARIAELVARHGVTTVFLSATLFATVLDIHPQAFAGLRQVMTGGERPSAAHLARLLEGFPQIRLVHAYGPVESMVFATTHRVTDADLTGHSVPIGRPISNTRMYVLDRALRPVPVGVPGEVYIAGAGLADGYLNQPEPSAERFVADPYGPPGERMYRTGDLASWRGDGTLDFLGRVDDQVKIRGFRVEPGEVQAVLAGLPGVRQAVVVARTTEAAGVCLVAYVVGSADTAELRAATRSVLPDYMVPSTFVAVEALPMTPNGKVDHRALPTPTSDPAPPGDSRQQSARQEILCGIFAELLGLTSVPADASFFDLGGHSLLAARLLNRVRAAFNVELEASDIFRAPTPAALDARLASSGRTPIPLRPVPRPDPLPVSSAQRRLWMLDLMRGPNAEFNVAVALHLHGALDPAALAAAIRDVVARHEVLRTVFREDDGEAYQHIVPFEVADPEVRLVTCAPDRLRTMLAHHAGKYFDLAADLPIRATVFQLCPDESVLLIVVHHIACDGVSLAPLMRDLGAAYAARRDGRAPVWEPLAVQYADYALWHARALDAERADGSGSLAERQLRYWRKALAGLPSEYVLPHDRPRPSVADASGDCVPVTLCPKIHRDLAELARHADATLFMVLHAGLAAVLVALGAGTDVVVGTPVAGRSDAALDGLVGFFVNSLVLRTDVSGDLSFDELLARVRSADLEAFDHQEVPFERVVSALNPSRALSRHPLFQTGFALEHDLLTAVTLDGLDIERVTVPTPTVTLDLDVTMAVRLDPAGAPAGIDGTFRYATALYDRSTIEHAAGLLERLLAGVVADPDAPLSVIIYACQTSMRPRRPY